MLDALGLDDFEGVLDIQGIRGYRSGDGKTPFRELTAHSQNWHPAKANDDEGPFGVLEVMGSVFPTGTDGVRSLLTHLGDDAINLLQGIDDRIIEYENFVEELRGFCESNLGGSGRDALESLMKEGERVREGARGNQKTAISRARDALRRLLGIVGTRDQITLEALKAYSRLPGNEDWAEALENFAMFLAAQEGRLWHGGVLCHELWYEDEFKVFSRMCRRVLAERQGILAEYRAFAKRVRDEAGRRVLSEPKFKRMGDEIRVKAQDILRNRCYLEGDWRGETPLSHGEFQ